MVERRDLRTIGGIAAVMGVVIFVLGGVIGAATGGPDTVIPETGDGLTTWVGDVVDNRTGFDIGTGMVVLAGILLAVALLGFYDVLRDAGPAMILAPVLGIFGLVLVTISHSLPIVMAEEFASDFAGAGPSARITLQTTGDLMAGTALATNYVGDLLLWAVAVPLFGLAAVRTRAVPRWIGWLGLFVGVVGGWIGAFGIVSSAVEDITAIGFLAFFVWMIAMGVALLRAPRGRAAGAEATGADDTVTA
jgi:Domain of unknown function (DUF4386)